MKRQPSNTPHQVELKPNHVIPDLGTFRPPPARHRRGEQASNSVARERFARQCSPFSWVETSPPPNIQAEEEKEAKLQAWLAIKKRFRGLTLGTAVRVSGRLLALMVYEFPDQPGTLR